MNITVLIPHFRTRELTAYTINQFLKNKGSHDVRIIVIDNSYPHESGNVLKEFGDQITVIENTSKKIQSHGVAFNMAMPFVETEYFLTAESDSFPVNDKWLDYYENLISNGFEWGGSVMKLSGGSFIHPTGTFYKTSLWHEAKKYCDEIQYSYFPNMSMHTDFACHLMVSNRILDAFLDNPSGFIEVANDYKGKTRDEMLARRDFYLPMVAPFHNGMGMSNESLLTFGKRNVATESRNVMLDNRTDLINRIGYEPGQWFCYWLVANGKNGALIPIEIKWMRNRGNQQQEYTINEAGFKHLWCGSSFYGMKDTELNDVYEFKKQQVQTLSDSLPENLKTPQ